MDRIGKYDILGELGQGGMGMIYKGRDAVIGRDVAIKVIQEKALQDETIKKRFYREARSAGRLSHPNITIIYDVGEEGEMPYLVMEFLEGSDLRTLLNARFPLSTAQKLSIATQICSGLHYAHTKDIIHRDVKPENIRVLPDGTVKIMDFGIARIQSEAMTLTHTNMSIGTPRYMAPEQVRGDEIDHRADIFSFGVVLYELLAGENPFSGDHVTTIIYKILNSDPPPLVVRPEALSAELQAIVSKCLAKNRDERYASFEDIQRDLLALPLPAEETSAEPASGDETVALSAVSFPTLRQPTPTPTPIPSADPTAPRAATPPARSSTEPAKQKKKSRTALWAVLSVVAFVVLSLGLLIALGSGEAGDEPVSPAVADAGPTTETSVPADDGDGTPPAGANDADALPRPDPSQSTAPAGGDRAGGGSAAPATTPPAGNTPSTEPAAPANRTPDTAREPAANPDREAADRDRDAMDAARALVADQSGNAAVAPLFQQADQARQFGTRNYDNGNYEAAGRSFRRARDLFGQIKQTLDAGTSPEITSIEADPSATGDQAAADRALKSMQATKTGVPSSLWQSAAFQQAQAEETAGTQAYNSNQFTRASTRYASAQKLYERVAAMKTPEAAVDDLKRQLKASLEGKDAATMTNVFHSDWSAFFSTADDISVVVNSGNVQTTSTRAMVDIRVQLSYKDNRNRQQQAATAYTWTLQYMQDRNTWTIERVIKQ